VIPSVRLDITSKLKHSSLVHCRRNSAMDRISVCWFCCECWMRARGAVVDRQKGLMPLSHSHSVGYKIKTSYRMHYSHFTYGRHWPLAWFNETTVFVKQNNVLTGAGFMGIVALQYTVPSKVRPVGTVGVLTRSFIFFSVSEWLPPCNNTGSSCWLLFAPIHH
jgi:hypothetical protein